MERFGLVRRGPWLAAVAALLCCEPVLAPNNPSRLDELRQVAPSGYGTFTGLVVGLLPAQGNCCRGSSPPLAGAWVDLGIWHASPAVYRDTLTHTPPSKLNEPLFEAIASTTTDAFRLFQFIRLPRRTPFAFRVVPARGSAYRLTYGESLFGIGNVDIPNHPGLCVRPR